MASRVDSVDVPSGGDDTPLNSTVAKKNCKGLVSPHGPSDAYGNNPFPAVERVSFSRTKELLVFGTGPHYN